MTANSIEESEALTLDCNKLAKVAEVPGVLPCAGQNADTGEVILVAYVNEPAITCCARPRAPFRSLRATQPKVWCVPCTEHNPPPAFPRHNMCHSVMCYSVIIGDCRHTTALAHAEVTHDTSITLACYWAGSI